MANEQIIDGEPNQDQLDYFREDMRAILDHQHDIAKHQQDVRDKWQRFYTLTVGAIVSVIGVFVTTTITARGMPDNLREFTYHKIIPHMLFVGFGSILALGMISMGIYLSQIISYFMNYYNIANVYANLYKIHAGTIAARGLDNPFLFTYKFVLRTKVETQWQFARKYVLSLDNYAADFFSNCVAMILNALSVAAMVVIARWDAATSYLLIVAVFLPCFVLQIALRQILLGLFLYKTAKMLQSQTDFPAKPSAQHRGREATLKSSSSGSHARAKPVRIRTEILIVSLCPYNESPPNRFTNLGVSEWRPPDAHSSSTGSRRAGLVAKRSPSFLAATPGIVTR